MMIIGTPNLSVDRSVGGNSKVSSTNVHQIYRLYFENDLQVAKHRTNEQVSNYKNKQDNQQAQIEALRLEN